MLIQRDTLRRALTRRLANAAPTPGSTRTAMPGGLTPALHYHPNSESVTTSGGRLTGVAANTWSPALTPSATGPLAQTDARGIKRWRGEGSEYLDGPTSWFANPRALTVFIVGRIIAPASTNNLFSISYLADGVTTFGGSAALRVLGTAGIAQWPYGASRSAFDSTVNKNLLSAGSQMQVIGVASRTTANGGMKLWMNGNASSTLTQQSLSTTGTRGFRIGGYLTSNGATNNWDIYEIVAFAAELTDAEAQSVADALVANWAIPAITKNLVLEGDSITAGITEIKAGDSLGCVLTEPGTGRIEPGVRVVSLAVSGATIANIHTRRDLANGWPDMKIGSNAADNIIAVQIGRNDEPNLRGANPTWTLQEVADEMYNGAKAGAAQTILSFHNAASVGTVARGWLPVQMRNIQNGTNDNNAIELLADKIGASFATDVSGGATRNLRAITSGGVAVFDYPLRTAFYQNADTTHPNVPGTLLMATGGDTPQHGYASVA